ncbi:DUF1801 domain-containing protein [Candidatus Curtissbacteria bacterium]|nr:DUF1801 domain-containing protein [Candidatus Curtissbacteria bacterium]
MALTFSLTASTELRRIIYKANPEIVEGWKWNSPAFTYRGKLICWFWAFSKNAKLFLFEGVLMKDLKKLFNPQRATKRNRNIEFTDVSEI